jgi:hypothetical protein
MRRTATAVAAAVLLAGCGSTGHNKGPESKDKTPAAGGGVNTTSTTPNKSDKRAVAFDCIVNKEGIKARLAGENLIQVGDDPKTDPRIEFYVTQGEAEGKQFAGDAQGAEQIGSALLYVRDAPDDLLEKLETCLDNV